MEAYQAFFSNLKLKLPWELPMLRNAVFLDPAKKVDKGSLNAVTNLTKEVCKPLEGKLQKVFPTSQWSTKSVMNGEYTRCTHSKKIIIWMNQSKMFKEENKFRIEQTPFNLLVYHLTLNLSTFLSCHLIRRLRMTLGHPNSWSLHLSSK